MHCTVAVIVVADRAVEQMIPKNAVKGFPLRRVRTRRRGIDAHAFCRVCSTGSHQLAVHFHHAGVASLDWSQLWVIANLRNLYVPAVKNLDQQFIRPNGLRGAING
jgi:hypothetical protein